MNITQKDTVSSRGAGSMGHEGARAPPTFNNGWARGGTVSRTSSKK